MLGPGQFLGQDGELQVKGFEHSTISNDLVSSVLSEGCFLHLRLAHFDTDSASQWELYRGIDLLPSGNSSGNLRLAPDMNISGPTQRPQSNVGTRS